MEVTSVIAAILKSLRETAKQSQKEVAAALGLDYKRYNHYETGRSEPDIATMILLADYFGVTVDHLIGHEKEAPAASSGLSDREMELLCCYRDLNPEGQERLTNYADDLVSSGKYIKNDPSVLGKQRA
jgi:transcriptional regulator with XRE-family HTH domain